MRFFFSFFLIRLLILFLVSYPSLLFAEDASPLTWRADTFRYHYDTGVVYATGNVVLEQGDTTLYGDSMVIDTQQDLVYLEGNVKVVSTDAILYADRVDAQSAVKDILLKDVVLILSNAARISATEGVVVDKTSKTFKKARYTPCDICSDSAPLWSVGASKFSINEDTNVITVMNATLYIKDVPILWWPAFYYPKPENSRQIGLLPPDFGTSNKLGAFIGEALYIPTNGHQDILLTEKYYTKNGFWTMGQWEGFFPHTQFSATQSYTNSWVYNEKQWHTNLFIDMDYFENFKIVGHYENVSNANYYRDFSLDGKDLADPYLRRELKILGSTPSQTFDIGIFTYVPLTNGNDLERSQHITPYVHGFQTISTDSFVPLNWYFAQTLADFDSSSSNTDFAVDDARVFRIGGRASGVYHYQGYGGDFTFRIGGQYVAYVPHGSDFSNIDSTLMSTNQQFSGFYRLGWAYPFVRHHLQAQHIITPVAHLTYGYTHWQNPSSLYSFDDDGKSLNIYTMTSVVSPYTWDAIDSGSTLIYGLQWEYLLGNGLGSRFFVGQRLPFSLGLLSDNIFISRDSNILGMLQVRPVSYFTLNASLALDSQNFQFDSFESSIFVGDSLLNLQFDYDYYAANPNIGQKYSQVVSIGLNTQLLDHLYFKFGGDFSYMPETTWQLQSIHWRLTWENECWQLYFDGNNSVYVNSSINLRTFTYTFGFKLKTLG